MSLLISFFVVSMIICFNTGVIAIIYGIFTRTWQYLVLSPISMYCSYELISATHKDIIIQIIRSF